MKFCTMPPSLWINSSTATIYRHAEDHPIGKNGGVMTPYIDLTKFVLGGKQGIGNQMFSWIHVEDMFNIVRFVHEDKDLSGILNCSAPHLVTNREQMKLFRSKMNKSFGIPTPKWMLTLDAIFIGTETELVLKSRWVIPERLQQAGFEFSFSILEKALEDILVTESK